MSNQQLTRTRKKMRNLRNRYNYQDHLEMQDTINNFCQYLLPLLLQKQNGVCLKCGNKADKYDLHHVIYNPMLTMNELQALCIPCHKSITSFTRLS